jgi:hypothetical protein
MSIFVECPIEDSAQPSQIGLVWHQIDFVEDKDEMSAEYNFKYQIRAGSQILRIEIDEDKIRVFELLQIRRYAAAGACVIE